MRLGRRQALSMKRLSAFGPDYSSKNLSAGLDRIWAKQEKSSNCALINTRAAFRWTLGPAVFSHMLTTACEWAQAFSIQTTVAFMGHSPWWNPSRRCSTFTWSIRARFQYIGNRPGGSGFGCIKPRRVVIWQGLITIYSAFPSLAIQMAGRWRYCLDPLIRGKSG